MKKLLPLALLLSTVLTGLAGLIPFAPPWDDVSPGPTDLRSTIPKPAGAVGFVTVMDAHFYTGDQRLRIFGINFTAGAGMPDHATADKVAARLARFGFNAVRFHFLDSTWGKPHLIDYDSGDSRNWNTNALDNLDYFISRLRAEGVYSDLNLLVGREFGHQDGVDPQILTLHWKTAHALGFFHAPLLAAQQQYARQLLTHRNPYTGLTYAEDPAVALVEINNENGLIHAWLGRELDGLPDPFSRDLQSQWNTWLSRQYADDHTLAQAWQARIEPLAGELLPRDDFRPDLHGWNVEQHDTAIVEASATNGIARIHVRKTGSAAWHVQLTHAGLNLAPNGLYTLSFRARADQARHLTVSAMQAHAPWQNTGLQADVAVEPQWHNYTFAFVAAGETNARIGFTSLNQRNALFQFSDVSLRPGGNTGLAEGESLASRTVGVPQAGYAGVNAPEKRADWIRFLWETEQHHWREMRRFLHDDLHVRAPVVGTIVGCSTPNLMADLDAIDTHAYWQHPHFPGKPWDPSNWNIENISMVDHPEASTITHLAFAHVAGKPQLVTEYNHPAPNVHASEGPLFVAAYGALQDWDGIFLYTYAHDERGIKAGCIPGFFDIGQHPADLANIPAASLLFRRMDVAPARQCLSLSLPPATEIARIAQQGQSWRVLPDDIAGLPRDWALRSRIALNLTTPSSVPVLPAVADTNSFASDTGELLWRLPAADQGVLTLRTPRAKFVIGHVDGQTVDLGHGVSAAIGTTCNQWCTLSLVVLEGAGFDQQPRRVLLAATGHTENTDMEWKDKARSTVGKSWGQPPSLVEAIPATIHLPHPSNSQLPAVYQLSDTGQRTRTLPVRSSGLDLTFDLPPDGSLWYEIDYSTP